MMAARGPNKIPKIDRLVLTTDPTTGISLIGYVVTLARLNVYPTASMLFQGDTLWMSNTKLPSVIRHVAQISGHEEETIRNLSNLPEDDGLVSIGKLQVVPSLLRQLTISICPGCWSAKRYAPRLFEIMYVQVCTDHRLEAVTHCGCGGKIWPNGLVQNECPACKKSYDLGLSRKSANTSELAFVFAIQRMIEEGWGMLDEQHPFFTGLTMFGWRRPRLSAFFNGNLKGYGPTRLAQLWERLVKDDWLEDGSPNPISDIPIEGRVPRHWIYRG